MTIDVLPVPVQSPSAIDCTVSFNSEYVPFILGGLEEYLYHSKWDGDFEEKEQARQWIFELIRMFEVCNPMPLQTHFIMPNMLTALSGPFLTEGQGGSIPDFFESLYYQVAPPAVGNEYGVNLFLNEGSWNAYFHRYKNTNCGDYYLRLDGVTAASLGGYTAVLTGHADDTYSFTVPTSKVYNVSLYCGGKSQYSTDYFLTLHYFSLRQIS